MRCVLAVYLCLASAGAAEPGVDEPTPVVIVRLASMAKLRADAAYVLKLAEFSEADNILSVLRFASGNLTGIAEYDDERPMTVVFAFPAKPAPLQTLLKPACVAIVPVNRLKRKIVFSLTLGPAPPVAEKIADDLYRWKRPQEEDSYVLVDGNVALMSTNRKLIETIHSQMEELTRPSDENMTAEIELRWRNVSGEWKAIINQAVEESKKSLLKGNDALKEDKLHDGLVGYMANLAESLVDGCDSIVAAWNVDPKQRQTRFRVRLRALENSSLDAGLSFFSRFGTSFASLRQPDSDLNSSLSLRLDKETIDLVRLFEPAVMSPGTRQLMQDPAVFSTLRPSYDAYLDRANAIDEAWLSVGRVDAACSVREKDGRIKAFGGWHAAGAETVNQPAAAYFQQAAAHSTMFQADAARIGELRLHRVGTDSYIGYAEDAVYVGWGIGQSEDWSQWASGNLRERSLENGPSVFIEGNCAFVLQQRVKLKDQLPRFFMSFFPELPAAGRFQMTVDRRDQEVVANLTYDELALKSIVAGLLDKNAAAKAQSLVDGIRGRASGK